MHEFQLHLNSIQMNLLAAIPLFTAVEYDAPASFEGTKCLDNE